MHAAERTTGLFVVLAHEIQESILVIGDSVQATSPYKDLAEHLFAGVTCLDLVLDTAQKRLIHERAWIEVRGEDQQLVEGNLELTTSIQFQEIYAELEWHDPAIQEIGGTNLLAAKVVNQKHSRVGLELEWRLVGLAMRVIEEV